MSRIDRIQNAVSARRASRTETDRPEAAETVGGSNLPVPITPVDPPRTFRDDRRRGYVEVAAQIIGQHGERRGLRAGSPLLDRARDAYNRAEWSGKADRRARVGRTAREVI